MQIMAIFYSIIYIQYGAYTHHIIIGHSCVEYKEEAVSYTHLGLQMEILALRSRYMDMAAILQHLMEEVFRGYIRSHLLYLVDVYKRQVEACSKVPEEQRFVKIENKYQSGILLLIITNSKTGVSI